jgi:hypothetical protein
VVLDRLPAYPVAWTLPLVAISVATWAVVPQAGLAWLLGLLAFPVFNVSVSLGVVYLVFAVTLFLLTRGRPIVAAWPVLALLLTPAYLTLLAPPAGRRWAASAARSPPPGRRRHARVSAARERAARPLHDGISLAAIWPQDLAEAGDPLTVVVRLGEVVLAPECLLQMSVWAGVALAAAFIASAYALEVRLWVWALTFAGVFAAYRVAPVAVWEYPAPLAPLLLAVALAAGVILFLVLLTPPGALPEDRDNELLQID